MNCYKHEKRVQITNNYNIECVAHIRLLNGQTIRSDANKDIIDTYYIFRCVNKNNKNDVDRIICGTTAAKDFLQLAGLTAPPIFNMLHDSSSGSASNSNGTISKQTDIWNESAKQLYNAIMILITAWNLKPGPIYKYLENAKRYKYCVPFVNRVDQINQIIHRHNTSLRNIINTLAQNNDIKNYEFNLLEDILHHDKILSYFEDENGR